MRDPIYIKTNLKCMRSTSKDKPYQNVLPLALALILLVAIGMTIFLDMAAHNTFNATSEHFHKRVQFN